MISARSVVVASSGQVSSELADEVVVLDLNSGVYHGLSPVAARAWAMVQQPTTVADVRDRIVGEYDVQPGRCENDLLALFQELEDKGLIECDVQAACA